MSAAPGVRTGVYEPLLTWWQRHDFPVWVLDAIWMVALAALVTVFVLVTVLFLVWLERKISADIQSRVGPNRTGGRFGLLQTAADALKLLMKEDTIPACADTAVFVLAPFVVFVPTLVVFLVIPFSDRWVVKDLNIGLLFVVAVSALPVIGVFMAGWGSNSKYAIFGAMRAAAQGLSYEIPLILALVCVVVAAGSLRIGDIVEAQRGGHWFILRFPLQLAFLLYFVAAMAEVKRVPFDLPEAESELVAGYHVEYSGMRFAFFFLAEFAHLFFVSALSVTLFFGAWEGPVLPPAIWFLVKTYAVILVMIWVRWTVPRLRIDQVMGFAWKVMVPLGLLAVLLTGLVKAI
ncbi:MAG: NADH-quinone oxidoreductase subunit NuoH [Armatimonadetes bacterium]|nr:NADH-quinone oxidoreductase subunit NuoH [Armatimonadota bacterium]